MATSLRRAQPPVMPSGCRVYAYFNLFTQQVLYSLTRELDNTRSLKQLPFAGKKTVPRALRKDHWKPLFTATFDKPLQALDAYRELREWRKLREVSVDKNNVPGLDLSNAEKDRRKERFLDAQDLGGLRLGGARTRLTLHKRKMKAAIMNQKANSVADLAAVLQARANKESTRLPDHPQFQASINRLKALVFHDGAARRLTSIGGRITHHQERILDLANGQSSQRITRLSKLRLLKGLRTSVRLWKAERGELNQVHRGTWAKSQRGLDATFAKFFTEAARKLKVKQPFIDEFVASFKSRTRAVDADLRAGGSERPDALVSEFEELDKEIAEEIAENNAAIENHDEATRESIAAATAHEDQQRIEHEADLKSRNAALNKATKGADQQTRQTLLSDYRSAVEAARAQRANDHAAFGDFLQAHSQELENLKIRAKALHREYAALIEEHYISSDDPLQARFREHLDEKLGLHALAPSQSKPIALALANARAAFEEWLEYRDSLASKAVEIMPESVEAASEVEELVEEVVPEAEEAVPEQAVPGQAVTEQAVTEGVVPKEAVPEGQKATETPQEEPAGSQLVKDVKETVDGAQQAVQETVEGAKEAVENVVDTAVSEEAVEEAEDELVTIPTDVPLPKETGAFNTEYINTPVAGFGIARAVLDWRQEVVRHLDLLPVHLQRKRFLARTKRMPGVKSVVVEWDNYEDSKFAESWPEMTTHEVMARRPSGYALKPLRSPSGREETALTPHEQLEDGSPTEPV